MAQRRRKKHAPQKIKKYRKPLNLNIGMVIFSAVFIYVVICVVMYFRTNHVVRYEVKEGSLSTNNIYRGIILRDEELVMTETAGYVNYYAREGERVAKNDLVYTIDETGRLNEYLENINLGENTLDDKQLADFRSEIVDFSHHFDPINFQNTYDFKYYIKGMVLKLANSNMMKNINDLNGSDSLMDVVDFCKADTTGIVAYWTDGYETLTPGSITADYFNEENYTKKQLLGTELLAVGDTVYKISKDENWSIVIPIDEERGVILEQKGYVNVLFLKNQYKSYGATKLLHSSDGNTYLQLTFTNSMITFITDRFLDIELIVNDEKGLKIPNSSIVEREFFLVPDIYITKGGERGNDGVIRQCYLEDGTISSEFIETPVYSYNEESKEYYLDTSVLEIGDVLIQPESQSTYTMSRRATLIGVYNMNKGYADFSQINIINQNEEYSIVQSNTKYGLNVYDYIVLNAVAVKNNEFISE